MEKQKKLITEAFDMKFLEKKIDVGINYHLKLLTNASEKKRVYFQVNEHLEEIQDILSTSISTLKKNLGDFTTTFQSEEREKVKNFETSKNNLDIEYKR